MESSVTAIDDEAALVAGLRQGDPLACERIVRVFGGRMLAAARRLLGSVSDAEEAVQDAFMWAFRSLDQFRSESRVGTWLQRIAINAALMKLRTRARKDVPHLDDLLPRFLDDGHAAEPPAPWRCDAVDEAERAENCAIVRAAIDRLPESHRTVLLLRDIEELDTAEAAAVLGITENAAKIRLHRARQALRALLDPTFRAGGEGTRP